MTALAPMHIDSRDGHLIALGQLLHHHGLLPHVDIDDINRRVGRREGEQDLSAYDMQLMFGFGCTRITIYDRPLIVGPQPFDEWFEEIRWDEPDADIAVFRPLYRHYCQAMDAVSAQHSSHPDLFRHEQREPTLADIDRLLADGGGWDITFVIPGKGWELRGIVFAGAAGDYRAYEPTRGEFVTDERIFCTADGGFRFLTGWQVPR